MIASILRFEWRLARRRPTPWAAVVSMALFGFMLGASGFGTLDGRLDAPANIAEAIAFLSLLSIATATLLGSATLLREREHRMAEIIYSTAISEHQLYFGRWLAAVITVSAATALGIVGLAAGTHLVAHHGDRVQDFAAASYVMPALTLALPSVILVTTLMVAVAAWTRSGLKTHVSGIALYGAYFTFSALSQSPLLAASRPTETTLRWTAWLDPFGLAAIEAQTWAWTAAQRDHSAITLDGPLLGNRLLWLAVAAVWLRWGRAGFSFRLDQGGRRQRVRTTSPTEPSRAVSRRGTTGHRPTTTTAWACILPIARLACGAAWRGWPFAVVTLLWLGSFADVGSFFHRAEFGSVLRPTTGLIIDRLLTPTSLFGTLIVVFWGGEILWRDRSTGFAEIIEATPVSNRALAIGRLLALVITALTIPLTGAMAGGLFQLVHGETPAWSGWAVYLVTSGVALVLLAMLTTVVQNLVPHRAVGMLVTLALALVWHRGWLGGPRHPLLRFAAPIPVPVSDLAGISPAWIPFASVSTYWLAGTLAVLLVTIAWWRRGTEGGFRARRRLREPMSKGSRIGVVLATGVAVAIGGLVFAHTHVVGRYETSEDVVRWRAAYERAYGHLADRPQPRRVAIQARIDLDPSAREAVIQGSDQLENRTGAPIDTVWIAVRRDVEDVVLHLDGHPPEAIDEAFGMARFTLVPPLAPGARAELTYRAQIHRRDLDVADIDHDLLANGTFLFSTSALPDVGLRVSYLLRDAAERQRQGLPSEPPLMGQGRRSIRELTLDLTVSTDGDQTVVAPGDRVATWSEGGRSVARFRVERPMVPFFALASARYDVAHRRHQAASRTVDLEVFHHPRHAWNVERMLDAAAASLDAFEARLGAYPHDALRIVEVPAFGEGFAGLALPGVIFLVEDRGFVTRLDAGGPVDLVTKRIAHEVSHQWWGHQLSPADEAGGCVLVESVARYAERTVLVPRDGEQAWTEVLRTSHDRYRRGRGRVAEPPLVRASDEGFLCYEKGALVLSAVADLIGDDAVDRALGALMARADDLDDPAGAEDLVALLLHETPLEHRALLETWWREVTRDEISVHSARSTPLADGSYRVTIEAAARMIAERDGVDVPLDLVTPVEIAVYAVHPNRAREEDVLYRAHVPSDALGTFDVVVPGVPGWVVADPGLRRIDFDRADNVRAVEVEAGS